MKLQLKGAPDLSGTGAHKKVPATKIASRSSLPIFGNGFAYFDPWVDKVAEVVPKGAKREPKGPIVSQVAPQGRQKGA